MSGPIAPSYYWIASRDSERKNVSILGSLNNAWTLVSFTKIGHRGQQSLTLSQLTYGPIIPSVVYGQRMGTITGKSSSYKVRLGPITFVCCSLRWHSSKPSGKTANAV